MHCTSSRNVVHSLYSLYGLGSDTGKVCTGNSYSQKIKNYWKKKVISEPSNTQSNQINHIFFLSLCDRKNNNWGKRKGCTGNGFARFEPVCNARSQHVSPTFSSHPTCKAPMLSDPNAYPCIWWAYEVAAPCSSFGLSPAKPYGSRPSHHTLAGKLPSQSGSKRGAMFYRCSFFLALARKLENELAL